MSRRFSALVVFCVASAAVPFSQARAEPGQLWEIGVEMEGMPFAMPKQKVCSPKGSKEPPVTKDDGDCKILEKKQTGNRFQWKAQCKDGTMVGDITSTPTSYNGTMKMTEKSGSTMSMKMAGKHLGDCDFQDRSGEIKAVLAKSCQDSLEQMYGSVIVNGQCPKEKPVFCQRLATAEGYDRATRHMPVKELDDPNLGIAGSVKACGLDQAKLRPRLCAGAVTSANFAFVERLCASDKPKLCDKALAVANLDYVSANCPGEKAALLKQHCEGRGYSSQVEQKYRAFCASAASGELADDGSAARMAAEAAKSGGTGGESAVPTDLQDGVKKLRGLFGF
jgi:hypothetical protein